MKKVIVIMSALLFSVSAIFILYPTVSSFINKIFNNSVVEKYNSTVSALTDAEINEYLSAAEQYNEKLREDVTYNGSNSNSYDASDEYASILNFDNGQIGSVSIPKINVNLPIYHGTNEEVLKSGAAHLPNTSLPIGGVGTHSAISAHTAYPSKVFFDDLDELKIGDKFYIKVLNKDLCYRVCDINIVLPDDSTLLQIATDKDYVTLITCYPYAVNSHRLLVRGERVENTKGIASSTDDEISQSNNSSILYICIVCVSMVVIVLLLILLRRKRKSENKK